MNIDKVAIGKNPPYDINVIYRSSHSVVWELADKAGILRQHCADIGRDPADIEISVGVQGSPEEVGPKLRSLGASLFTVGVGGPDYDLSELRNWITWRDSLNS